MANEGTWRKSSRSELSSCVEVAWRKSSSSHVNGDCVEVAFVEGVSVRDSKRPEAGRLAFPRSSWDRFLHNA